MHHDCLCKWENRWRITKGWQALLGRAGDTFRESGNGEPQGFRDFFPEIDFSAFSHCKDRESQGYWYCKGHMKDITSLLKGDNTIKLIAHSMGCSFAEGMAKYLIERGYTVTAMIHINAFQAGEMTANDQIPLTIDFQYTDDIIIRLPFISCPGDIKGAVKIRERSHTRLRRRHRGPVYPNSTTFWERLKPYIDSERL